MNQEVSLVCLFRVALALLVHKLEHLEEKIEITLSRVNVTFVDLW